LVVVLLVFLVVELKGSSQGVFHETNSAVTVDVDAVRDACVLQGAFAVGADVGGKIV